jgi:hypothetical protein
MNRQSLPTLFVLSLVTTLALAGCGSTVVPDEARSPAAPRELNRADAIASAREDASRNYGNDWGARAEAQYRGGFWVVELHAKSGYTLHYAISARDGSIHERSMVQ